MEGVNKKRMAYGRQSSSGSTASHASNQSGHAPSQSQAAAGTGVSAHSQALYHQKVRESNEAVNRGDFRTAIHAYSEAIALDPTNHILYTNRSTAFAKIQQFQKSLLDARKARELNPKWAKAYIREGSALQQLGQHADALAAFASGLAHDANNNSLLSGLTEAALKCPLKEKLEPIFQQLQKLKLDKSPFVIISVIGQELLQAGHYHASIQMLEAALQIGSCSLKLRGSVFSALSSGYWGMGNIDKAITYMQKDLQVAKHLGDADGECRAYGNLGSAYFSKGHYKEALSHDRFQLVLAMRLKDRQTATIALGRLGHVYTAIGDYPNALQSHKQCVLLLKQSNEKMAEGREIGNVGAVYLAMGNFQSAVECHLEHLKISKTTKNSVEEARAYSNLGSAYHYKRNYEKAIVYHKHVLKLAEQKCDKSLEARAYAGLGHAARCMQDYSNAETYHKKQLDNALQTRDRVAEGRACSNLGIIFHQLGEYEAALKLHKVHLSIAKELFDRASQGRALGNIGNAYSALNQYEQAIKYHKQELAISTEVNDRHSEGSTHGNLAVAYQALKLMDSAHHHYVAHLNISRELKDSPSEGRAVCNLGNYHSSRGEYTNSIPYYEQYLMLSQELHDSDGEAKACFCLGYAHFALGNYPEAVRYYEQDLSIAQELKDQLGIARAFCNLGLAQKALNNFDEALECQKKCLNLMTSLKNVKGRFRSMGNIGDILLKTGDTNEAVKFYNQQLQLAKQSTNMDMLAAANGSLGSAHRSIGQHDKALAFHTQELSIRQDMNDLKGECRAHGNLGSVHMCLGKYMNAFKCYEEQLEKSRELQDSAMEANACGNLAITKMNMGNFEEAIGLFEQQLAMLEQVHGNNATFDKGRAFGNLGDCYEALGDFDESIKCHEQYLAMAQNAGNLSDQDKAYRGLGNAHRSVGNLQQALVCFEKRLVVAHELSSSAATASAYGELGCLHSLLGNFEQAISCLQHQLRIAREMSDSLCEGDAACGLGGVYQQMGEYEKALEYHEMDLRIAESTNNTACQCRAYGNLGLSHESLGEYQKAIRYQEQHLSIAAQMNDRVAKTLAYSSLGRVHHALNNHPQAVEYLRQGLQIAEQLGRMEDEAKIRHRLGLALWANSDYEECQQQLYKASELFESIRRDAQFNSEYKLSLFDLQTACYQALQRVLVTLSRHQEALVVAERACTRAFIDLLMERQAGSDGFYGNHITDPPPITTDQITSIVDKQRSLVLYFSVASGFLYSWLLTPNEGIVKFHETSMADVESEVDGGDNISMKSSISFSACSLLDNYVGQIRESMGVESHAPSGNNKGTSRSISLDNDSMSDIEDRWEEISDKLNADNDRTGFLRIVNRNHLYNSSNYSIGSLFSMSASLNGCSASFPGSAAVSRKNSVRNKTADKSAISALYHLLIEPFEETLQSLSEDQGQGPTDLILVLQGELYLIPFSVLRKDQTMEYLFERFNLIVVPSMSSLQNASKHERQGRPVIDSSGAVIVGNPKLTPAICQHWHLHHIPSSEYEARIVGEILTARPLIGQEATKAAVLNQIEQVEVLHFATHVSWKLSSIILSPGEVPAHLLHSSRFATIDCDDSASDISSFDGPSLSEYLLTAADILNLKLHAKLVVLSAGYTEDRAGRINSDGVVGLTRSLLSAGAQSVLFCLWPVPEPASKLLMRTFYVALQEGQCVSQALTLAVKTVQSTKQFSHPSNWGGWVLMGQDVKLSSKVAQMGHAICELLQHPNQCREAMRVLLHLIEKSLQRIHQGMKNSMYTTAQSIENKVAGLPGWKDLLQAVGFRFEPSLNGLPPAVFFPQSDPGDRLTQASASLQSLLGLPQGSLPALSKFLNNYDAGEAIIRVMRDILSKLAAKDTNMEVKVNVKLWRVAGCHEFLASLSMDLVEVGNDEITLRLGKQANKRQLQFALQALVAVFDTQEAPRSLSLDSSSSLESLSSSQSGSTSTSNFSSSIITDTQEAPRSLSLDSSSSLESLSSSQSGSTSTSNFSSSMITDTQEAPRSLSLDSSSSLESLSSSQSGSTSTSNFSSSTPPLSPRSKKRSLFNPAEMEKMRIRNSRMSKGGLSGRQVMGGKQGKPGTNDPSICLQYQNQIKNRYKTGSLGQLDMTEVCVTALSDSDTPISYTESPTFSNTGNEKFPSLHEIESYELSFDGRSDKSDPRSFTSDGKSTHSSIEEEERIDVRNVAVHFEESSFKRNGDNRNSDISDNSSQGIQADSGKRGSDISDMSEGRLTPKNQRDLEVFLQTTDESGIMSGATSSNQSDGSQQSDQTNFRFDPTEIAQKIMSEVSEHKSALETMQTLSMFQTQSESNMLRSEFQNKTAPSVVSTQEQKPVTLSKSMPNSSVNISESSDVQSNISSLPGTGQSAFTSPAHSSKVPPPIAAKPAYKPTSSSFRNLSSFATNSSVHSDISPNVDRLDDNKSDNVPTPGTGQDVPSAVDNVTSADVCNTTAIVISKQDSFSSSTSASTTMSFSSFRPPAKTSAVDNTTNLTQYRPDSSTSTSSYCSTPCSMQSVIYKPHGDKRSDDSPCVGSYDSSSEQTSGSGSNSTITPTINMSGDSRSETASQKRDASPALSTCSSASSKSGKQKKKVSFSDSEPSDTPSPLNSSANSNQISYFDMKHSSMSNIPSVSGHSNLNQTVQFPQRNSSSSSIDSAGMSKGGPVGSRPPPPSYQYAIKNSVRASQSPERTFPPQQAPPSTLRQTSTSNSSLNSSLEEANQIPPNYTNQMPPGRFPTNNLNSQNSVQHRARPTVPNTLPYTQSHPVNSTTGRSVVQNRPGPNQSNYNTQPLGSVSQYAPPQSSSFHQSHPSAQQTTPRTPTTPLSPSTPMRNNVPLSGMPLSPNPPMRSNVPSASMNMQRPPANSNVSVPLSPNTQMRNSIPVSGTNSQRPPTISNVSTPVSPHTQMRQNVPFTGANTPRTPTTPMSPNRPNHIIPVSTSRGPALPPRQPVPNRSQISPRREQPSQLSPRRNQPPSMQTATEFPPPPPQLSPRRNQPPSMQTTSEFPPPPPQFRGNQDSNPIPNNQSYENRQSNNVSQNNYRDNMNVTSAHGQYIPGQGFGQFDRTQGSRNHQQQPSQNNIEMKQFPRQSINNFTQNGPQAHSSPVHRPHVKRTPPVPPARIDSWENMDRRINEGVEPMNGEISNNEKGHMLHQNGFVNSRNGQMHNDNYMNNSTDLRPSGDSFRPRNEQGDRHYDYQLAVKGSQYPPTSNGVSSFQEPGSSSFQQPGSSSFQQPGLSSFQQPGLSSFQGARLNNQVPPGPLRRVNIGSDKNSFARTNVIQSSKC